MITVAYHTKSKKTRKRTERIQLIATGLTMLLSLMDPVKDATLFYLVIRITAIILGIFLIGSGLRYERALKLLGDHFETTFTRLSGIVLLLGGILLRMQGSKGAYLVQIIVGILFIAGLPIIIKRIKGALQLRADKDGITYSKRFHGYRTIPWEEIGSISFSDAVLVLKSKKNNRSRTFYLEKDDSNIHLLRKILEGHFKELSAA